MAENEQNRYSGEEMEHAGHEDVVGPRGEVAQPSHGLGDLVVLAGQVVGHGEHAAPDRAGGDEHACDVTVPAEEGGGSRRRRPRLSAESLPRPVEKGVRHARERRDHDDERSLVSADELHHAADGLGVRQGRPAELPDLQPLAPLGGGLPSTSCCHLENLLRCAVSPGACRAVYCETGIVCRVA